MASNSYDVIIVGMGVAGVLCAHRIATKYKGLKVLGIDTGRPAGKRKMQCSGWLGTLPSGDGKLYSNDVLKVADLTSPRQAKTAHTAFKQLLNQIEKLPLTKDRSPHQNITKKLEKLGYHITTNDYTQIYPKEIHALSRYIAGIIELNKNISFSFDNQVMAVRKQKNGFIIDCEDEQEYKCKKLVIAVGRAGWKWAQDLFQHFGLIEDQSNDYARFGIRVEVSSHIMKDFNRSNCTLTKEGLEIGPLCYSGSVIPEDHFSCAISAFRSNEDRWKTDKVSFNIIGDRYFPNRGFEEMDRLANLTFVMANDRILKERISSLLNGRSKITILKEYDWLKEVIRELSGPIVGLDKKGYYHVPTIIPSASKINIGSNLETEIDGMYVCGESAGINGILAAATMGVIVADSVVEK